MEERVKKADDELESSNRISRTYPVLDAQEIGSLKFVSKETRTDYPGLFD